MCCDDLDLNSRYVNRDDQALLQFTPFELTQEHWNKKVANYNMYDTKAGRSIKDNVKEDDFEYFRDIVYKGQCWFCEVRFTNKNPPTLDRIDNSLGYSKNNVQLACQWCKVKRGNRDPYITKGLIQLKRYYLAKGLPMPLTDEETFHKLRPNITGRLANAFHRYNVKDETHINKLKFEGQNVVSYDLDYIMTQVCEYDLNSLYPSVMSGIPHDFIKYTCKKIYMPGYELDRIECETDSQKLFGLKIINNPLRFSNKKSDIDSVTVFIAEVKGHIDYKYINDYINCPPIIRKYKYKTLESVIGDFMHQHMKNNSLKTGGEENKLTVLLSTMGKYMCFYSYYLWLLIDDCHFIIDDVKCVMTFSKHIDFESFVRKFMQQRIQSKIEGNSGGEQFSKITMNSSYGSDGMNQEHFSDIKLCDIHETFRKHLNCRFKSDRKLGDNLYAVEFELQKFNCKTCLQVAFTVLDCAKYWFMNFYYNFLTPMIDMNRVHLIYCDTDSMMLSVAGDPKQNYQQGFSAVIKDKQFYEKNFYKFFPKPKQLIIKEIKCSKSKIKELQIQDEKKRLGVAYEHCGSTLIALAPKNYWLRQEFDKKDPIVAQTQQIKFPFKSKIKAYEQVHGVKLEDDKKQQVVPDYQIKQLPEKFGRPYFSYEFGSWEIDIVFSMNPGLVRINQIYLFCINVNTKYLVVYPLHSKSQEDIEKALQNLVQHQHVTHIRGDGEKGFASNQLMQFYNKNSIKTYFVNGSRELTNHNRVVDSVIRTIRNAFGYDDRDFANPKLMQQMVDIYNDTPHGAFDNKFTPKQVNSLKELEGYFIRKNDKKLREVKQDQQNQGFTKYLPGNILMIHVDYLRTMHRYMKKRRNFNELAKFIKYDN
ncbi:MAG: hypothetical protein EZS28_008180 [Streblomastix strix]|uniref:DNA-directed DNA polymerase n=1 Tax=Streblomastix strix TaxID=222440 RepID=A0A5J4WPD6_9EUKA|nr:MAG: hypothetical protein EZS28_008180 [Streblomastix strix]